MKKNIFISLLTLFTSLYGQHCISIYQIIYQHEGKNKVMFVMKENNTDADLTSARHKIQELHGEIIQEYCLATICTDINQQD